MSSPDNLSLRVIRYAMVGGTCTIVDFAIFILLFESSLLSYMLAGAVSFSAGSCLNYFLCIRLIFDSGVRFQQVKEVFAVFAVAVIGLGIHQLVLYGAVELLSLHALLAKTLATGLVFSWNFCARQYYVFSKPGK